MTQETANPVSEFWDEMKFCGCGFHGPVLGIFRDVMQTLHDAVANRDTYHTSWEDAHAKREAIFAGNLAWEYLVYYVLDSADLIEHGSSIPGWLTDKGEKLLAAMAGKTDDELAALQGE